MLRSVQKQMKIFEKAINTFRAALFRRFSQKKNSSFRLPYQRLSSSRTMRMKHTVCKNHL